MLLTCSRNVARHIQHKIYNIKILDADVSLSQDVRVAGTSLSKEEARLQVLTDRLLPHQTAVSSYHYHHHLRINAALIRKRT